MSKNLIYLLALAALVYVALDSQATEASGLGSKIRSAFHVPKALDFGRFREKFGKHYGSVMEMLARQKIYLARAFKAFVSAVNFKHRRSNYYLRVNHMSDWTDEERSRTSLRTEPIVDRTPTVDPDGLEKTLSEVIANREKSELLNDIAEELTEPAGSSKNERRRKRRDVAAKLAPLRQVNPDELAAGSDKSAQVEETPQMEPEKEASILSRAPGYGILKRWLNWSPVEQEQQQQQNSQNNEENEEFFDAINDFDGSEPAEQLEDEIFIDLRKGGCINKPKSQGSCGSCYIFATLGLLEHTHCKQTGNLVSFSEKYVLDCSSLVPQANGCNGGITESVVEFAVRYGLDTSGHYPYYLPQASCPFSDAGSDPETVKKMGFLHINEDQLISIPQSKFDQVLEVTPILILLYVPTDFQDFGGGVHNPKKNCNLKGEKHSMLAVGKGRRDGREYYIYRNSYSSDWGEDGYYNLDVDSINDCTKPDRNQILLSTYLNKHLGWNQNENYDKYTNLLKFRNPIRYIH